MAELGNSQSNRNAEADQTQEESGTDEQSSGGAGAEPQQQMNRRATEESLGISTVEEGGESDSDEEPGETLV